MKKPDKKIDITKRKPKNISVPFLIKEKEREVFFELLTCNRMTCEVLKVYEHTDTIHYMITGLDETILDVIYELGQKSMQESALKKQ